MHYRGLHCLLLQLSWGLILLNSYLASAMLGLFGRSRERAGLFRGAVLAYPGMIRKSWGERP
jgi:hypothetical protein